MGLPNLNMNYAPQSVSISWAITFMAVLTSIYLLAWGIQEWKPRKSVCSDFTSPSLAMIAFRKGAKWLDRNRDGIPCNLLSINR